MVPRIDGGRDQRRGLRVGAGDYDELCAHHVRLGPTGDKSVDVLLHRYHDFASHMAALLGARCLIFDVDASSARFDKHPHELQRRCEASMARIGISDDRS